MQRIKVVARVRPLTDDERAGGRCVDKKHAKGLEVCTKNASGKQLFDFDYDDEVLGESATQAQMYDATARPLVDRVFDGFNATVMAYGQTGSGKTHTMGAPGDESGQGVTARVVAEIFARIKAADEGKMRVTMSYVQVYNEAVYDLLPRDSTSEARVLTVRDDGAGGVVIQGLCEREVSSAAEVDLLLERGARSRRVGATAMNSESSRSHALLSLSVARNGASGKLTLVDLAGSERVSKTGAEGSRFAEGVQINRGLLALGNVVSQLAEQADSKKKAAHVGFRDSKLTRLLRDSLGGTAATVMIACVSAAAGNAEETLNTLRYAARAQKISNDTAVRHRDDRLEARDAELAQVQAENAQLQAEITRLKEQPTPAWEEHDEAERDALLERLERLQTERLRLEVALDGAQAETRTAVLSSDRARLELESLRRSLGKDAPSTTAELQLVQQLRGELETLKQQDDKGRRSSASSQEQEEDTSSAAVEALACEERAMEALREQFLSAVSSLEAELSGLEQARDRAAAELAGASSLKGAKNVDSLREELRMRKAALAAKARELEGARLETRRLEALRQTAEKESLRLRQSAKVALAKRVDLEKKLRGEAAGRAKEKRENELSRIRANRQTDRSKAELAKLKSDHERSTNALKRRVDHQTALKKVERPRSSPAPAHVMTSALATKLDLHVSGLVSRQLAGAPSCSSSPPSGHDEKLLLKWYHAELIKSRLLAQRKRRKSQIKATVPSHTVASYKAPLNIDHPARRRNDDEDESSEWDDDEEDESADEDEAVTAKLEDQRTVAELKEELRKAGLKVGGRKSELLTRLQEHQAAETPLPPPPPTTKIIAPSPPSSSSENNPASFKNSGRTAAPMWGAAPAKKKITLGRTPLSTLAHANN